MKIEKNYDRVHLQDDDIQRILKAAIKVSTGREVHGRVSINNQPSRASDHAYHATALLEDDQAKTYTAIGAGGSGGASYTGSGGIAGSNNGGGTSSTPPSGFGGTRGTHFQD